MAKATQRTFLGFAFWVASGKVVRRRVSSKALGAMKDRVRQITRPTRGRSLPQICADLRSYLGGWKEHSRLAETPRVLSDFDEWIRHRLRAVQLKQRKRGRTIYRELRARGLSSLRAAQVAANARSWWRNSAMAIHGALPDSLFATLGVPRLGA